MPAEHHPSHDEAAKARRRAAELRADAERRQRSAAERDWQTRQRLSWGVDRGGLDADESTDADCDTGTLGD